MVVVHVCGVAYQRILSQFQLVVLLIGNFENLCC